MANPLSRLAQLWRKQSPVAARPQKQDALIAQSPVPSIPGRRQIALSQVRTYAFTPDMDQIRDAEAHATDPVIPRRWALLDIYREAYRDLHLQSEIRKAKTNVTCEPWAIVRRGTTTPDTNLARLLQASWAIDLLDFFLDAEFWGHSLIEFGRLVQRDEAGMEFDKVYLWPRKHVSPDQGYILINQGDLTGIPYREAPFNRYIIETPSTTNLGLLLDVARQTTWKRFSRSDWAMSSEKWSDPIITMKTAQTDDKELRKKEDWLKNLGKNSYLLADDTDEINLIQRNSTGQAHLVYKDAIAIDNEEISKIINGQTLTGSSDGKGSYALGEVHERQLDKFTEDRLRRLTAWMNEIVIPFLVQVNGGKSAYSALAGYEWKPLRFLRETPDPNALPQMQSAQPAQLPGARLKQPEPAGFTPANRMLPSISTDLFGSL